MDENSQDPEPPTSANDLTLLGKAAIGAEDYAEAERHFQRAAELIPEHSGLLHNWGYALFLQGNLAEAERVLSEATGHGPIPGTWTLLAEIYEKTGRQPLAFRCYKQVLKSVPNDFNTLMRLGALKEAMGDRPGGRECYRLAAEAKPNNIEATTRYVNSLWEKEPEAAVKLCEDFLTAVGGDLNSRFSALHLLICKKEWWERIRRGETPYHAARLDELFFNYALDYVKDMEATCAALLEQNPSPSNRIALGTAKFCLKDRHGAEALFSSAPEKTAGHILENVRFAPEFYEELRNFTPADLTRNLPDLIPVTPLVPDPKGVLYLSCNFTYLRAFALPMVASLKDRSPETPVHLHVMDADEEETKFTLEFMKQMAPLRYAISVERPGLQNAKKMDARCYYHAVRLIRFANHLQQYKSPLWLMDVDALVNRDLTELFGLLKKADVSMRIRPGRMEPWNQFNACIVGASTSAASLEYFRLVAAYIAYFQQRGTLRWGIDQLAMYGVFEDMQDRQQEPKLALLGEVEVDYNYLDDGFVWCNSGIGKFKHLQRISKPGSLPLADFEGNRFVGAFEEFWTKTQRYAELAVNTQA